MKIVRDNVIMNLRSKALCNKRIVCIGAGQVAHAIGDMLMELDLLQYIDGFVDSNLRKVGLEMQLCNVKFRISSFEWLENVRCEKFIFLVTVERYLEILDRLQKVTKYDDTECYLIADLNFEYSRIKNITKKPLLFTKKAFIPKMIHYCWFGKEKMPDYMRQNIKAWRNLNPEYEIICHDESNYDIGQNLYMTKMYDANLYAFVSDYARLDILYQYGGVYLDTDVKLLKKLDELRTLEAFVSYNIWPEINSGIMGAKAGNKIVKEMRDIIRSPVDINGEINKTTNNVYETLLFSQYGFKKDFTYQIIQGVSVIPPVYLATFSELAKNADITDKTIAIHMTEGSWRKDANKIKVYETGHINEC